MRGHHLEDGGMGEVPGRREEAGGGARLPARHPGDQPSQAEARGHREYSSFSHRFHNLPEPSGRISVSNPDPCLIHVR